MSLTDKEIEVVTDALNDEPTIGYVGTPLDTEGAIDFDKLRDTVHELGPLRMRSERNPYTVELSVHACGCAEEGCSGEFVIVRRRNGLFSIQWMLDREEVEQFDSLDHLRYSVLAGNMQDSCAERQIIENEIEQVLGQHYLDVKPATCFCSDCAEAIGKDQLPLNMLLSQMASNLTTRLDLFEEVREQLEALGAPADALDKIEDYVSLGFDLGYQLGRQYSEYQVKRDIEVDALAGKGLEALKAKRAKQAGLKSAVKRQERMMSLMASMEALASGSPALLRVGPEGLAKLACEDATHANPSLWSQGAGQVDEYLGIIRRGEAGDLLKARYFVLFPPKLTPHHGTA